MKKLLFILILLISFVGTAQVIGADAIDLEEFSQAQIDGMVGMPEGRTLYNTTTKKTNQYNGTAWVELGSGGGSSFTTLAELNALIPETLVDGAHDYNTLLNKPADIDEDSTNDVISSSTFTDRRIIIADGTGIRNVQEVPITIDGSANISGTNNITLNSINGNPISNYALAADYLKLDGTSQMAATLDMNNKNIDDIQQVRLHDTDADTGIWSLQEITNAGLTGDLAIGHIGVYRHAFPQSGVATHDDHVLTKGDGDALYSAGTDDQTATEVPTTPFGNLTSTNVQNALDELQTEINGLATTSYVTGAISNVDEGIETNLTTTNFNNNLSGTDTDVQKALDTLDDLVVGGGGTDDQNILGSGLAGTNLTIGIEGGTNEVVDLAPLTTGLQPSQLGNQTLGFLGYSSGGAPGIFALDNLGTAGQVLAKNSGNTGMEWIDPLNDLLGEVALTTTRTAVLADKDGIITNSTATDYTYTINAGIFPVGTYLHLENFSTGNTTAAYGAGVTGEVAQTFNLNSKVILWQRTLDNWIIYNGESVLTTAEKAALPAALQSNARFDFYLTD